MRHNIQTRRPKKRPTHLTVDTESNDQGTTGSTVAVPVNVYPTMLFVYKFDQPTILKNQPPEHEDFKWVPISIFSKKELDEFTKSYGWNRKTKFRAVPVEFARMLAKIAYSYSVAELGLDGFSPTPLLLDIILQRSSNVSYVVGGDWEVPPPDPRGFHHLQMIIQVLDGVALIIIEIRLFPAFETPNYRVVVGKIDFSVPEQLHAMNSKMKDVECISNTNSTPSELYPC